MCFFTAPPAANRSPPHARRLAERVVERHADAPERGEAERNRHVRRRVDDERRDRRPERHPADPAAEQRVARVRVAVARADKLRRARDERRDERADEEQHGDDRAKHLLLR